MKIEQININKLLLNSGQIDGLPKNPRFIKDEKFELLKQSLIDSPDMLELRELIVYPYKDKYIVIAGNMRLRVLREIGEKKAHCKILPSETSIKKLREYSIKDNISYGETDQDILSEWPNDELDEWGFDDIFDNENESEEVKIKTEIPFTMTHYLISFPPEKLIDIQPFLEKIMQFDGIEIETGSN